MIDGMTAGTTIATVAVTILVTDAAMTGKMSAEAAVGRVPALTGETEAVPGRELLEPTIRGIEAAPVAVMIGNGVAPHVRETNGVSAHVPDCGSPAEIGADPDLGIVTIAIDGNAAVPGLGRIHGIVAATATATVRETKRRRTTRRDVPEAVPAHRRAQLGHLPV
jgi:hypothetical protein